LNVFFFIHDLALDRDLMELLLILLPHGTHIEPSKNRYRTSWVTRRVCSLFTPRMKFTDANDIASQSIPLNLLLREGPAVAARRAE
jgi:hypothetical protein